ncbi:hypothetical protein COU18_00460 [Candidatus Kaiserbacteria bacterium CG10_big_fil_rev_8_21_14_0_10_51_14]|uniref:Serine protease n=1 Tax=Candidatus Kaiserbacteria bacterium CG10_big_fil_rev_8_21_14_0_10_51_14 TaxID=1974610 RepID=A0A2H0UCW8_9BACT|nr:MAG: hypothetical protein COU18_00460 [Candidatus Kaiserbacteria bacterium CG10_big_fil_rev_8_21_14_0_10_51_14]
MHSRLHSLFASVGALGILVGIFFLFLVSHETVTIPSVPAIELASTSTNAQTASAGVEVAAPVENSQETTTVAPAKTQQNEAKPEITERKSALPALETKKPAENEVVRIQNPYPFPPQPTALLNDSARAALVNILCTQSTTGAFAKSISGSGVIIDPRGVILTNAHVAQYVLLSQDPRINISCVVRTGAPATPRWVPEILFIPSVWVEAHANEINMTHPLGTGENDYGLLLITKSIDGSPLASLFSYLPVDTREAIGFQDDQVIVASYPTEFIGSAAAQFNLYPVTSITTVKQLLTFANNSVDLLSLGGVPGAQGGSSGGAAVNAWGFLIGLISTTSEGDTTATRDLRAITLSYINRDLAAQTQFDLATILKGDVFAEAQDFNTRVAPSLINLYLQ